MSVGAGTAGDRAYGVSGALRGGQPMTPEIRKIERNFRTIMESMQKFDSLAPRFTGVTPMLLQPGGAFTDPKCAKAGDPSCVMKVSDEERALLKGETSQAMHQQINKINWSAKLKS